MYLCSNNLLHFLFYRSMPSCVLLQYSSPTCVWGQGYCNRTCPYWKEEWFEDSFYEDEGEEGDKGIGNKPGTQSHHSGSDQEQYWGYPMAWKRGRDSKYESWLDLLFTACISDLVFQHKALQCKLVELQEVLLYDRYCHTPSLLRIYSHYHGNHHTKTSHT